MATRLEGTLEPGTGRGNQRYDWSSWLDGSQWKLVEGVDFVVSPHSFRTQAQNAAKKQGCKLVTRLAQDDEGRSVVLIQAKAKPAPGKSVLQLDPARYATTEDAISQNEGECHAG